MPNVIRVCLVDDQALVRRGICALLALFEGIQVIAEAENGEQAIETVLRCPPDVLLLDVRMPKLSGVQVIAALAERGVLPPTLLLTTFEDDAALVSGIKAGARGYLLKGVTPETLIEAIRTAAAGGTYLYAPLAAAQIAPPAEGERLMNTLNRNDSLTPRERDVLKLMTSGIGNGEIAEALQLSEGTVRNHVSNILAKFRVADRTKAVLYAIQRRLV